MLSITGIIEVARIIVFIVLALAYTQATSSSSIVEAWSRISVSTGSGDEFIVEVKEGVLSSIVVAIDGKRINLRNEALLGLGMPWLNRIELATSFGVSGDQISSSSVLSFPILDADNESNHDELDVVWFVFRNGRFVRRDLWSAGQKMLKESIHFSSENVEVSRP